MLNVSHIILPTRLYKTQCSHFLLKRFIHPKDKFDEFNNMYQEMFTPTDLKDSNPHPNLQPTSNEVDEINDELEEVFGANHTHGKCLDGKQLESISNQDGRFIINSLSHDPYFNLAMEDYVFRHTPLTAKFKSQRLITYINDKCVVIGKNQILWKEVFFNELRRRNFQFLRRFSGGGTVVHDLGNVNYSFVTSRDNFERTFFNKNLVEWLNKYTSTQNFKINMRGDITFRGVKCSGSAYKIARGKSYHHGTMLINSELDQFKGLLKPKEQQNIQWETSTVESMRSDITNINFSSIHDFIQICNDGFKTLFDGRPEDSKLGPSNSIQPNEIPVYYVNEKETVNEDILQTMDHLKSFNWKFLCGPKFKIHFLTENKILEVEKGKITNSNILNTEGLTFQDFYDNQRDYGLKLD